MLLFRIQEQRQTLEYQGYSALLKQIVEQVSVVDPDKFSKFRILLESDLLSKKFRFFCVLFLFLSKQIKDFYSEDHII